MNISVAMAMAKAAFLEVCRRSGSAFMIFWTRATEVGLVGYGEKDEVIWELDLRGRETCPLMSLGGAIGVLLYGILWYCLLEGRCAQTEDV
jgi:hypothetical protein